jgi:predicted SAM-dependent methyltransferase
LRVKTYLNLGCGERFHPDWINVDLTAGRSGVIAHDLARGIPFPSESADAVYLAAVFEHIRRNDTANFLREIFRVLKPGGTVRVGVPDLEQICRIYLEKLEAALAGDKQAVSDYDWMMLEMFDQMVRETSGGSMLEYLKRQSLPNEKFIVDRIGDEGRDLIDQIRRQQPKKSFSQRIRATARAASDRLLKIVAGRKGARAFAIGRFRLSGEVHHWMYDRFSLARELTAAGFSEPTVRSASESAIPDWNRYCLDVQSDGTINKPDLFFMEAIKPQASANG